MRVFGLKRRTVKVGDLAGSWSKRLTCASAEIADVKRLVSILGLGSISALKYVIENPSSERQNVDF